MRIRLNFSTTGLAIIVIMFSLTVCGQNKLSPGEHFARVNRLNIHYYVGGNGPLLLFPSPGWGLSVDYVRPMKSLEKHFKVVYYDTRHSGKSTGPEDSTQYSGKFFTDDMDSLRTYFGYNKVWLAGHSGGGFQVLRYGIYHSDHLYGIIEMDAIADADSIYLNELQRLTYARRNKPYFTPEKASLFMGTESVIPPLAYELGQTMEFYFHNPKNIKKFPKYYLLNDKARQYTLHLFDENLLPELHKINVPVLVIVGDDDIECDLKTQATRIYENLQSGNMAVINNCGHCPWLEQPRILNAVIDAWLEGLHIL